MNICAGCGVELDEGLKICPLCGRNPENPSEEKAVNGSYPSDIIQIYRRESGRHLWELGGIIAFSCVVFCTIVDLLIGRGLRWSLYADVSIILAWVIYTLFMFAFKKPFILFPCILAAVSSALFFYDLFSPPLNWFVQLGFPITLALCILTSVVVLLYRVANFRGFNIIAISLASMSAFCVVMEIFIDLFLDGRVNLRWSLIETVSVLPVALIFIFIHYRMKRGKRLDSFFHV